jgi:hypothetical protein
MSVSGKSVVLFLCASLLTAIGVAAFDFAIDPLQLFHAARFTKAFYTSDDRMQAAGLIRSRNFDTVFIGTSLAVHFRPSDIDKALGVKSVKLAMSGSTSPEQHFAIQTAIAVKHPKEVIWEMDDWIFRDAPDVDSEVYFPADLYRRNLKGIAGYLLSLDTARESIWLMLRHIKSLDDLALRLTWAGYLKYHNDNVNEIDTVPMYVDQKGLYGGGKAMASYQHYRKAPAEISAGYNYDAMVRNFDRDALDLIRRNSDVRFVVYFPPYSILQFVAMRDAAPATLKIVYDFTAYASRRLAQFPNVRLYDFREAKEVTHDLNNYADVVHHSPAVDLKGLSWLAEGKYVVDREAPTAPLERLKAQVEAFQIDKVDHRAKAVKLGTDASDTGQ